MTLELCVIEGDGVGSEVIPAAEQVLTTVLPELTIQRARAGWGAFQTFGTSLPDKTIDLARKTGAVLFGAASSPSHPVTGYYSPIVRLRRLLKTHANIRPITYLPVPTARAGVDLIVVRENTEDIYVSEEEANDDVSTAKKIITRDATERIAHTAYRLARLADRRKVTIVHKGNILTQTDGLFRRVAFEVSEQYTDIETDELLIDTAAYWMVKEPTRFDIVLTMNQYGDILSDMAAAWGGGLGFVPALNYGEGISIAEPVHGSAPDIAGRNIANPTATILSAALLVRYRWERPALATQIEQAVKDTLDEGIYTPDVWNNDAVSTTEFTDTVCEKLHSSE
jgi:homoisocitrate dehydrogenase